MIAPLPNMCVGRGVDIVNGPPKPTMFLAIIWLQPWKLACQSGRLGRESVSDATFATPCKQFGSSTLPIAANAVPSKDRVTDVAAAAGLKPVVQLMPNTNTTTQSDLSDLVNGCLIAEVWPDEHHDAKARKSGPFVNGSVACAP